MRARGLRALPPAMALAPRAPDDGPVLTLAELELWEAFEMVGDPSDPQVHKGRCRVLSTVPAAVGIYCRDLATGNDFHLRESSPVRRVDAKPLEGETVVVTGEIPSYTPRTFAWWPLEKAGARIDDKIRKSTSTIVVAGNGTRDRHGNDTTKIQNARRWGIPIVRASSSSDFERFLKQGLVGAQLS